VQLALLGLRRIPPRRPRRGWRRGIRRGMTIVVVGVVVEGWGKWFGGELFGQVG